MPRPRKPQWVSLGPNRTGRWRTKIDGKWHYAPATIGQRDVGAAWAWLHELERRELHRSTAGSDPTCYWLVVQYLKWAEGEVEADRLTIEQWKGQRSRLKLWLKWPGVTDCKARVVTVDTLQAFFDDLGQRASSSYVAGVGRTIRTVWRWGARPVPGRTPTRLIPVNPFDGFAFPRSPTATKGYVEGAVVRRFIRWAWARARALGPKLLARRFDRLFLLMLWFERLTGARPGEACSLRWADWDRESGKIVLKDHKTAHRGKTRTIYVTAPVARLLRTIERLPDRHDEYVFTHRRGNGAIERGHLVALAGEPWPSGSAASAKVRQWREEALPRDCPACEGKGGGCEPCEGTGKVGVVGLEGTGPRKLVAYCNRHGYASEAVNRGLTIEHTAELLGNSPQVTAQVYAHVIDAGAKERAERMAARGRSVEERQRGA